MRATRDRLGSMRGILAYEKAEPAPSGKRKRVFSVFEGVPCRRMDVVGGTGFGPVFLAWVLSLGCSDITGASGISDGRMIAIVVVACLYGLTWFWSDRKRLCSFTVGCPEAYIQPCYSS